jgi:hypothetical protein
MYTSDQYSAKKWTTPILHEAIKPLFMKFCPYNGYDMAILAQQSQGLKTEENINFPLNIRESNDVN